MKRRKQKEQFTMLLIPITNCQCECVNQSQHAAIMLLCTEVITRQKRTNNSNNMTNTCWHINYLHAKTLAKGSVGLSWDQTMPKCLKNNSCPRFSVSHIYNRKPHILGVYKCNQANFQEIPSFQEGFKKNPGHVCFASASFGELKYPLWVFQLSPAE